MGERKKCKAEGIEKKSDDNKQKKNQDGGEKKEYGSITVILKTDLHCVGCASKLLKSLRSLQGVESVKCGDELTKLTVVGNVDPLKLREEIHRKTHRMVEIQKSKEGGAEEKKEKGKDSKDKKPKENSEEKKPKEPPVTTAVLKVPLHCEGCIQKIHRIVTKSKGYHEMSVDRAKDLVTVKGSIDMKELTETLKKQLKKEVVIVPPKKNANGGGGEKKENDNAGSGSAGAAGKQRKGGDGVGEEQRKGGYGGGEDQRKGGDDGGEEQENGGGGGKVAEANNIGYLQYGVPECPGAPAPAAAMYMYNSGFAREVDYHNLHAPQLFSDENPNACSVM